MPETKIFLPPASCSIGGMCKEVGECHAMHLLINEMNKKLPKQHLAIDSLIRHLDCTHPAYLEMKKLALIFLASQK